MIGGSWRPTATHELLLEATVGDPQGAPAAFARWRQAQDVAAIDAGSLRLLPLLVPRAALFPADDPAWPVIRGCYRRAFFHGQMLRARAAEATQLLAAAGIPVIALKGGALLRYHDGNPALRPMNDFDGWVPRGQASAAIRTLLANGWRSALPLPELLPEVYHSACFTSHDGLDFDLHWHLVPSSNDPAAEDNARAAAIPCDLHRVAIHALSAEDLLTVVCAHAAQWSPVAPVRWVADSLAILRCEGTHFDWPRVVKQAMRWHVVPHLVETLRYLRDRWSAAIPDAVFAQLASAPVSAIDRRAYTVLGRIPDATSYLMRPWHRYRVRTQDVNTLAALPGFIGYLKITLGRAHARDVPMEILARFRRWRRDRAIGRR